MKKARVVLLNPPTADKSTEVLLGLAYLASSLRKDGHKVKVIDATAPYNPKTPKEIEKIILDFSPHFIGVTLTISYIAQTYVYLRSLQKLGIPIVVGGSHVNPLPEEALSSGGADIVVIGEGENTIVELANYFAGNNIEIKNTPGLYLNNGDGQVCRTPPRPLIENLNEIPFPAFEDFPISNYTGSNDVNSNSIFWGIFSSRGCPFNCTFCCGYNVFGRTYRLRSARNIFEEIKSLVDKFGVKKIAFQDDEILLKKERIIELCDLLTSSNLKIKMSLRARIDSIETSLLKKMQEAGFRRISFGIESWNDETLLNIKKKYILNDIRRDLNILKESRFPHINFNTIIGFPWETKEHLQKNLQVLSTIPNSLRYFSIVVTPIPYPNTELYNTYHKQYGFTNWWLDPHKHLNIFAPDRPKPIFFYFAKMITTLYVPDIFWNYSSQWKKEIEKFSWKVFKLYLRRHIPFIMYLLVYLLCRISHFLWRFSPKVEAFVFKCVPKCFIHRIEKLILFVKME